MQPLPQAGQTGVHPHPSQNSIHLWTTGYHPVMLALIRSLVPGLQNTSREWEAAVSFVACKHTQRRIPLLTFVPGENRKTSFFTDFQLASLCSGCDARTPTHSAG